MPGMLVAEQYTKPPWWLLHLNSSFPLAANLGKFTLITSNHFFEKLPQSMCAPISRPLKIFSTPLCMWWSWKGSSHALAWYCSGGCLLTTNRDETNHPHTQNSWVVIFLFCNQQDVMFHASYLIIIVGWCWGWTQNSPNNHLPRSPGPLSPPLSFCSLNSASPNIRVRGICVDTERHT